MKFVVNNLLQFDCVQNREMKSHIKYEPHSPKTLMKYVDLITRIMERKISNILPKKFAIVFRGWSEADKYFFALYATLPSNWDFDYDLRLLSFTLLANKTLHSAQTHVETVEFVLGVFHKFLDNVVTIV